MAPAKDRSSGAPGEAWVGEALSANFAEACNILGKELVLDGASAPSDTLPLLRIAEVRCEIALVELWSRMFVATIKRTCPLPAKVPSDVKLDALDDLPTNVDEASDQFALQVSAARAVIEEAINHIFSTTMPGSTVRTLACVTKGFWGLGFGKPEVAYACANVLAREASDGGPAADLACVAAFLELVFSRKKADTILGDDQRRTPSTNVDKLATATLAWLAVRRRHFISTLLADAASSTTLIDMDGANGRKRSLGASDDADLHRATLKLRLLLQDRAFSEVEIVKASTKQTQEAVANGEEKEYDLLDATRDCLQATEQVGRKAAGLESYRDGSARPSKPEIVVSGAEEEPFVEDGDDALYSPSLSSDEDDEV